MRFSKIQCIYGVLLSIWGCGFLMLHLSENGISLKYFFQYSTSIDSRSLRMLMSLPSLVPMQSNGSALYPLQSIYVAKANALHFYDLPKRRTAMTYTEITTANRDTRFPLAPDFSFHIGYNKSRVTLYEDYGPGCIFRIYLFPPLPTDNEAIYKMTSRDLESLTMDIVVDGVQHQYSLRQIMEGRVSPFVSPLNTRHPTPASGMGAYTPFCYKNSMIIYYNHDRAFPENLFQLTVSCTSNEMKCPVKLYASISRYKFPVGTDVEPFRGDEAELDAVANIAALLKSPESHGPDSGKSCKMTCFELCAKCQRVVFHRIHSSGVISSLKFRVFEGNTKRVAVDWSGVLLTAYFDVESTPQINRIPLGSLFGAVGSLNDFNGAAFGRRSKYCSYVEDDDLPGTVSTGYFYLPMPFWDEALIVLEGSKYLTYPHTVCYQVTSTKNYYHESDTGYLHASKSYFSDDASGWRSVLNVSDGWGHMVALGMEIDNLRAIRDVPLAYRWAVLQADNVIYIDGSKSPAVMGTGLEDYFSYAHGFSQAENTSYAFVGVHHASPKRKEPLTWHCYRQLVLDPIPFRSALQFVMEGTDSEKFTTEVQPLDYHAYRLRKLDDQATVSHLALYYYRPQIETTKPCDQLIFCDEASERLHKFQIVSRTSKSSGSTFAVDSKRFVGDSAHDENISSCGRSFTSGDTFQFMFRISSNSVSRDLVLTRTFHANVFQWNDKANIKVNDLDLGHWFIPMGPLTSEYSLRQESLILPRLKFSEKTGNLTIHVTITPLTHWRDLSYRLCFL